MGDPENAIYNPIMRFLKDLQYKHKNRCYFWRTNTHRPKDRKNSHIPKGLPDIQGVFYGQYIGIETKAPNGHLSVGQKIMKCKIDNAGGRYIVARKVYDVKKVFEELEAKI